MWILGPAQLELVDKFCYLGDMLSVDGDADAAVEARIRLGVDDTALILQQNRLRWYGNVLRKDDDDWVKKCMEYEVEGSGPRGRPKRTWKEVVREDCQARKLNKGCRGPLQMEKGDKGSTLTKMGVSG